jgi:ribosomal protein S18 acetylase RimI-like enzyme
MIKIISAINNECVTRAKELIQEYALSLGLDLGFQDFEQEMATFPSQYSPPGGCLFVAQYENKIVGCVGLRDQGSGICEMKRMYVQPNFRGKGLGKALAEAGIDKARSMGYTHMRLDTAPSMESAIRLYTSLGFRDIAPYRFNPIEGARYLELKIN